MPLIAWGSKNGFQNGTRMTHCEAQVRLSPYAPARRETRHTVFLGSTRKLSSSSSRERPDILPSYYNQHDQHNDYTLPYLKFLASKAGPIMSRNPVNLH